MSAENASHIDDLRFKAENEDGVVLECEALLMFDSPFFGKSYIVYTDGGTDEDGFTNVYASSYSKDTLMVPEDSGFASIDLSPIEDDEEWNIIQEQLERYQQAAGGAEPQDGEDPIPLITELNSGGELEPSFEYRFEDGSTAHRAVRAAGQTPFKKVGLGNRPFRRGALSFPFKCCAGAA